MNATEAYVEYGKQVRSESRHSTERRMIWRRDGTES